MADYQSRHTGAQIDAGIDAANEALPRTGGTMTGPIALPSAPTEELNAANKGYVDKNYTIPVKQYGNTPFVIIDNERMQRNIALLGYKSDGSTNKYKDCSPVMRCPKILGINVYGDARVMLYIGDMVDGEFVLDSNYIFLTSSTGLHNYINPSANRLIETDGSKYFYYRVAVDGEYEIIMGEELPENGFEANAIAPFYATNDGEFASSATYSSLVLPSGCYYAVIPGADVTADQRSRIHVSYHTEDTNTLTVIPGGISFGHIPDDAGAALLRFPDGVSPDDLRVYASKPVLSNANNARASVIKEAAIDLAKKFSFVSQKAIAWDDSQRSMTQGKQFYGVPYSSRWKNSHHVGFEVSCETALNALADEYSIAYDGGKYYESGVAKFHDSVSGHSEINQGGDTVPSGGGPGYGLVCSSFLCLINGNAYPQTNRGFTFDKGFEVQKRTDLNSGMWLSNEALSHCVFVDEIFDKGYSLYHGIQPCIGKTVQTSEIASNAAITTDTRQWRLNGYSYSIANRNKTDVNQQLMKLDVAVAGGNIRPWRGNKAVYGPWDKSANGCGIGITIHNGAATARLTTPSGTVHSLSVSGKVYLDIASYVTEDGTYTLDSGAGTTAEYFRYFNHDDVTLTFDTDGRAVLMPDAEYVYAKVTGYGAGYESAGTGSGPIVIAAGQAYPDLAADPDRIEEVYAAIVADPTEGDCWGRYSCVCSKGVWDKDKVGLAKKEEIADKVDYIFKPTANLCNEDTIIKGSWWEASGLVTNQYTTAYYACEADVFGLNAVTLFGKAAVAGTSNPWLFNIFILNASGNVISQVTPKVYQAYTLQLPSDAKTIRFNYSASYAFTVMVNEGTEPLPYVPYDPKGEKLFPGQQEIEYLSKRFVTPNIVIGSEITAVIGDTIQVFFDSIIEGDTDGHIIKFSCAKGKFYPRYWEYTPVTGDSGEYPIEIAVCDLNGNELATAKSALKVVAVANPTAKKHVLCIGDSTMENGQIPIEASRRIKGTTGVATSPAALSLSNIAFVGRKKNADETVGWEGTGGWTFGTYNAAGVTSVRFTVTGAENLNIDDVYQVGNFQFKIAEINVTNGKGVIRCPFYYTTPYNSAWDVTAQSGTLSKSNGDGQTSIAYTAWTKESYQPFWNSSSGAFDILSYRDEYCGGQIDAICVLLGINNLISADPYMDVSSVVETAKTFCRNVHNQLANCKILLSTLPLTSVNGGIAANYGSSGAAGMYNANGMNHKVFAYNAAIIDAMKNDEFSSYVLVVSAHAQFDAENGYPTTQKAVNTRVTTTEILQTNGVHPRNEGYWQISDALAFRAVLGTFA